MLTHLRNTSFNVLWISADNVGVSSTDLITAGVVPVSSLLFQGFTETINGAKSSSMIHHARLVFKKT